MHTVETRVVATRTLWAQNGETVGDCQTLGIPFEGGVGEEWRLPEQCAYSNDKSGGYQRTEHVTERVVVAARHTACTVGRSGGYQNTALVFNMKLILTAVNLTVTE